jgi:hypothetical protein
MAQLFTPALLSKRVYVDIAKVGSNINVVLLNTIRSQIEGKCIVEGYVQKNTTEVITYSSGLVSGDQIAFDVAFKCLVCYPAVGMEIDCYTKNITKAGIQAVLDEDLNQNALVIFIARDHHLGEKGNKAYASVERLQKENQSQRIKVRVVGQRFELNDAFVSVIAELVGYTA